MSVLHVVFKVGKADYLVAASEVLHMESYEGATPVPGTAPYVAGIVQVRGRVVPVVDLRMRFGLDAVATTIDTRVIVLQIGDRTVGFVVDSAREVLKVSPEQIHPPPKLMTDGAAGFVKAVAHVDKRLLMLIDVAEVAGEEPSDGE
jgi:purine-binding chemotaxis protein CheW